MKIQIIESQRAPATQERSPVAYKMLAKSQLVPGTRSFPAPWEGRDEFEGRRALEDRRALEVGGGLERLASGGLVMLGSQSKSRCIVDNFCDGGVSMACAAEATVKFHPRGTMSSLARCSGWAMVFSGHAVEHFLRR